MKSPYELIREREKKAAADMRRNFSKHEVTFEELKPADENGYPIQQVIWKQPDSGFYRVNYLLAHGRVHISGDLGSGTFQNGYRDIFELVHHDMHYLASKLVHQDGRQPMLGKYYSPELCEAQMKRWLKDGDVSKAVRDSVKNDWEAYPHQPDEWKQFVWRQEFAADLGDIAEFGVMLHPRVIGWLAGIEMAYKALKPEPANAG